MLKKYFKLLLVFLVLSSTQTQANYLYSILFTVHNLHRHWHGLVRPMLEHSAAAYYLLQKGTINNTFKNAPDDVINFCHNKLKDHKLDHTKFQVKILDNFGNIGASPFAILIDSTASSKLNLALQNKHLQSEANYIKTYSTFMDHEIGHIKNNDAAKGLLARSGLTLMTYIASSYLINSSRFNALFQKPTNIKEFLVMTGCYTLLNLGNDLFSNFLFNQYSKYIETKADDYAISCAQDPEALRCVADELEKLDPMYNLFVKKPASQRSFKQRLYTTFFNFFIATHPNGFDRAQKMRAAADALEAKLQRQQGS